MLTGDVNLMNVADPTVPFKLVAPIFAKSDFVFSNLECCFYIPPGGHSLENEGFFAEAQAAEALKIAGIQAVGIANNVNYGEAAILASTKRLDEIGVPHTGAGANGHDHGRLRAAPAEDRLPPAHASRTRGHPACV